MALQGVKYFSAVSTNKRFIVHQHAEEARIEAMQRRMLGRVWKEKEQLLNEFIKINVKTATGNANSRHIELKQMAVDPKLVLPMDMKSISLKHQAVIAPVITIDGRSATLYPKKGAKHGRHVELSSKVFERMHKATNISSTLEHIGSRETPHTRAMTTASRHRQIRDKACRTRASTAHTMGSSEVSSQSGEDGRHRRDKDDVNSRRCGNSDGQTVKKRPSLDSDVFGAQPVPVNTT